MKLIDKITIKRYRSFSNADINCADITVFSGRNNQGKSNVLKALNLFFNYKIGAEYNYELDYSKAFLGDAGGKRNSTISIQFFGCGNSALKEGFTVVRSFSWNGFESERYILPKDNSEIVDGNIKRQFTLFLNKLQFIYVPAIRDKSFTQQLFSRFRDLVDADTKNSEVFKEGIKQASEVLTNISRDTGQELQKFISLPTEALIDFDNQNLLDSLEVKVKTGLQYRTKKGSRDEGNIIDEDISLFSSGDGVLMSYVAYFLNYLSHKSVKQNFIWGFEEPENSLEYSMVQKLAGEFECNFKNNAQIFLTTHSPAFIGLYKNESTYLYRVYILPQRESEKGNSPYRRVSSILSIEKMKKRQLELFDSHDKEYETLTNELNFIELSKDIEHIALQRNRELLQENLQLQKEIIESTKPILFVEDEYEQIYKVAWLKLQDGTSINVEKVDSSFKNAPFMIFGKGGKDNLKGYMDNPKMDELEGKKVVGLFDFDDAFKCFDALKNRWGKIQGDEATGLFRKRTDNIHTMVLPVPEYRKAIAGQEQMVKQLSVELLFKDEAITLAYAPEEVSMKKIAGNLQIPCVKNKKDFWKKAINLDKNHFSGFVPLFKKVHELLGLAWT